MKVIVKSSNNHYTDEDIKIKDSVITTDVPFKVKHNEHESVEMPAGDYGVHKVVEVDPYTKELNRIAD